MTALKFQHAFALHQRGEIGQAEILYREILQAEPRHFDATHLLGLIALQTGHTDSAHALIRKATEINPRHPLAYLSLGNVLREAKRLEDALNSYDRALRLKPDFAGAHYNKANTLLDLKQPEEALVSYERALRFEPRFPEAHNNRGTALRELKRHEDALASYDQALRLRPDFVEALNNRGTALLDLERRQEALADYERALQLRPDYPSALNNRGNVLRELGRHEEALASFARALQLDPTFAGALDNCGNTLLEHRKLAEAAECFRKLLAIAPDYDYALGNLLFAQLHCCDWSGYEERVLQIREGVKAGKRLCTPFAFLTVAQSPSDQLQCARTFVAGRCPPRDPPVSRPNLCYQHDKIRVAYLSADFHTHATAFLMAELFERHDRQRFETTAISFGPDDGSEMRARLQRAFDRFVDVRAQSNRGVAELMRELEIDIAVDLKGFTTDCRPEILAFRPAPLQVSYLGFPGTLGAPYVDYILADRFVIPPEHQDSYAEKVVYLPECYQMNDSLRAIAERTPTRAEAGLPESGFVFCCFNNNYKITPDVFDVWMRLLRGVSGSILWLLQANAHAAPNLRRAATERGVEPERLIFAPKLEMAAHLARHRLADLFLDTLPINAHTTASDALWAGLPVLTCSGATFAGRVAGSLLTAVGLPELITDSLPEYESKALRLATSLPELADLRVRLERNRRTSSLFNTERLTCQIEAAFVTMLDQYRRGAAPASFAVDSSNSDRW